MISQVRDEPALLAELQKTYLGLAKVESWPLAGASSDGARNYRYRDTSGASFPVFADPATAGDPLQAVAAQIEANVAVISRRNATSGRAAFIVRRRAS